MRPGARVAAAIEILEEINGGLAAEQALTRWARVSRFAGSKDRAAVRDHVFDVLRQRQTAAFLGGGGTGRALMLGLLRAQGADPDALFNGEGHAPQTLSDAETRDLPPTAGALDIWNLPEWLVSAFRTSLGPRAFETAQALTRRAPVTLRVNLAKATRSDARQAMAREEITCTENPLADTALTVTSGERRLRGSACFAQGTVEFQDAASQAVVEVLPEGRKCLDFCAGGGGKALALAAQPARRVHAHDIDPNRMKDLPVRAARAGCEITQVETSALAGSGPFDLVLCDVPCSGSGAWRRAPEGKWHLTPTRLSELCETQDQILSDAKELVAPHGTLAYATCSVLEAENEARVQTFLSQNPTWTCSFERRFDVGPDGDGFYTAHLTRAS